ncbi:MAG TPA: transposase [Gemmatimonadaceae bacterium]|nr:transposase [Gemmatimonadaceae bacterium]
MWHGESVRDRRAEGRHFTCATVDRSAGQFPRRVRRIVAAYPEARTIHVVWDNLNIHCEKSLGDAFGAEEGRALWNRLTVHPTPKQGSWLNQADIELSLVSRACLGTRRLSNLYLLQREVRLWTTRATRRRTHINWRFSRRDAQRKFGYQRNSSTWSQT